MKTIQRNHSLHIKLSINNSFLNADLPIKVDSLFLVFDQLYF